MSAMYPALANLTPGVRVLVAGGTGTVGRGICMYMLRQGAKVVVASRSLKKFFEFHHQASEDLQPNLSFIQADLTNMCGVKEVFDEATNQAGGVQHVVASIRGNLTWLEKGSLLDQDLCEIQGAANANTTPHFLLMKQFLPYLQERQGSSYTVMSGFKIKDCGGPENQSSPLMCLADGGVHGLADAARAQYQCTKVAISELHLECVVHDKDDLDVCSKGSRHLGNDLLGAAVASVAAGGIRQKITIIERDDCMKLARTSAHLPVEETKAAPPPSSTRC